MNSGKDLAHMVQAQIQLEESAAQKIGKLEKATANLAAKLFLAEMRFDTEKHAKILQMILDITKQKESETAGRTLWTTKIHSYVDALVAKKMLEDHVKVETKMLKHVKEEIERTDDDALKLLFKHIADDERKHHKIMETILEKAFEIGP
jgi:bacterioferritin (cytochrome b1)